VSDARTRQYTGGIVPSNDVVVDIGEAVETRGGAMALLAVVNALARHHPYVFVRVADVALRSGRRAHEAVAELGRATETSRVEVVDSLPSKALRIGIGIDVREADIHLGAHRFTGAIDTHPLEVSPEPSSLWGGALAAMRAANTAFRTGINLDAPRAEALSLWNFEATEVQTGPAECSPIDVGTTWLVGAGGVGSSLAWWLSHIGVTDGWTVIDHDRVEVTNLNRSLGMFAHHLTVDGGKPALKAAIAADLMGATAFTEQWDSWAAEDHPPPDVLIPAANDFGVRSVLASYSHPMALTGATSANWTADLHVYRAGTDGCIECRHPRMASPAFECSTAEVATDDGGSADAALSFLSGTAGLLTAAELSRLQHGVADSELNHRQLIFFHPARYTFTASRQRCERAAASHALSQSLRAQYFGSTRWWT
jgi:hypothetical protein